MKDLEKYLKKNPKTHLIFDLDETIVKLLLPWPEWHKEVIETLEKVDPTIKSTGYAGVHNEYVKKHGDSVLNHLRQRQENFETERLEGYEVNDGFVSFIKANPQYIYFIWSSNSRKTIETALEKLGILKRFKKIISRSETALLKPEIEGFDYIEDKNVPKSQYLFVGDSIFDEEAARKIGIDFYRSTYFL